LRGYPAWVNIITCSSRCCGTAGINATLALAGGHALSLSRQVRCRLFRLAARIGMVELMRSGCGDCRSQLPVLPGMPFDTSEILFEEAEKLGLRFVLCRGTATRTRQLEAELPSALRPETLDAFLSDIQRRRSASMIPRPLRCGAW
jgi:hypothetical protein